MLAPVSDAVIIVDVLTFSTAVAGGAEAIVTHNARDFARAELRFPALRVS